MLAYPHSLIGPRLALAAAALALLAACAAPAPTTAPAAANPVATAPDAASAPVIEVPPSSIGTWIDLGAHLNAVAAIDKDACGVLQNHRKTR